MAVSQSRIKMACGKVGLLFVILQYFSFMCCNEVLSRKSLQIQAKKIILIVLHPQLCNAKRELEKRRSCNLFHKCKILKLELYSVENGTSIQGTHPYPSGPGKSSFTICTIVIDEKSLYEQRVNSYQFFDWHLYSLTSSKKLFE